VVSGAQDHGRWRRVYLRGSDGATRTLPAVVPNRWQGEVDCVVGPFSCSAVAQYFANRQVDFGQYESFRLFVRPHRDAWYVEVRAM